MTTTTWSTTADIPLNAWTPLVADMRALLDVAATGGATVTNPTGAGAATLTDDTIAFTVQAAPPAPPLTVQFTRTAGDGEVTTSAATTGGLVVAALTRAARYWGPLLTWSTEADTKAHAVARELVEGLFGEGDRATGAPPLMPAASRAFAVAARALEAVAGDGAKDLPAYLTAAVAELTAERDGAAIAGAMLTPKAAPAKVAAAVRAELAAAPAKRRRAPVKAKSS